MFDLHNIYKYSFSQSEIEIDPENAIEGFSPFDENQEMSVYVILHILSFLSLDDLGNCFFVNKSFKELASEDILWQDLTKFFPDLRVIDQQAWEKHVDLATNSLSFEGLTSLDKNLMIPELKKFTSLPIEGSAGFTLLTLPKGLSFNKLVEIAGSPKQGSTILFGFIADNFRYLLGGQVTEASCTVLISNAVLEGSRDKSFTDQQAIVSQFECEIPGVLDATTLVVLTHTIDGKPLMNRGTYTRCSEQIFDGAHMLISGFRASGLVVACYSFDSLCFGVSALRKF